MKVVEKIGESIVNWFKRRWDDYNEDFKKYGGL
jgi:hypothetical protein